MADYQLTATDVVIRTADHAHIPNDPANRDRIEYNSWVAAGNVPDPYVPPVPTRRQQADAHKAAGLTVNFPASSPGLGTYPVIPPYNHNYDAISTRLANGNGFPGDATLVGIFDIHETMHNFNKTDFQKFSKIAVDFVNQCNLYAAGKVVSLPPNNVNATLVSDPAATPVARLDAGVAAATPVVTGVRDALQALSNDFNNRNFEVLLAQMKLLSGAYAAMLEAQVSTEPPPP